MRLVLCFLLCGPGKKKASKQVKNSNDLPKRQKANLTTFKQKLKLNTLGREPNKGHLFLKKNSYGYEHIIVD